MLRALSFIAFPLLTGGTGMILDLLGALALLYLGQEIFIPIALAFVAATLLRPIVRRLQRWRIPAAAGAGLVVFSGLVILWAIGFALTPAVSGFVSRLPSVARAASDRLEQLPRPLDRLGTIVESAAQSMASPARAADTAGAKPPPSGDTGAISWSGAAPIIGRAFGTAAQMLSGLIATVLLTLFFLATGDSVRDRLARRAREHAVAGTLLNMSGEAQRIISRYLALLALINIGQGIVIGIAMALLGMPVPLVWGALTFVAEFFPYLGSATMVILLTLVGLATTGGLGHVLIPPLIYIGLTTLQNSLVSPVTYGRYLRLNPPAILVSVMIWWLMWGVLGAFLAVPILATIRVVCERQPDRLAALGALVEG